MDLLNSVLERLESLSDYFQFSVVCTSWYCVAKKNRSKRAKMVSTCHRPPMLLISNDSEDAWNVYNIMADKVLGLQLKVPNKRFYGSSNGWLIDVEDSFAITLTNPFFRVKGKGEKENSIIRLPPLDKGPYIEHGIEGSKQHGHCVVRGSILGDPLSNANDCIVVVIFGAPIFKLAFIILDKDTTWTYIDRSLFIADVVCFQGKYYAVDQYNSFYSFNNIGQPKFECPKERHFRHLGRNLVWTPAQRYLVDLNGEELLMVIRYVTFKDRIAASTSFEVWKMDIDKFWWIEKETLGDVAIFVDDNSSVFAMASNSNFQPNCIYFTYLNDRERTIFGDGRPEAFGVYNLQTKSFSQPCTALAKSLMKMTELSPTLAWVVPPLQL